MDEHSKEFWEEYRRLRDLRESRKDSVRHIPVVISHYGETVTLEGWHRTVPTMRNADTLDAFGNSQPRVAPTKGKAR